MRTTSIVVLFTLASGALSMPAHADNTAPAIGTHTIKTGSGKAAGTNAGPGSLKRTKTCDVHLTWGEGYLDYNDYMAQALFLCGQLWGKWPGKSELTGAVRCTEVPLTVSRIGTVWAMLKNGMAHQLQYGCLGDD